MKNLDPVMGAKFNTTEDTFNKFVFDVLSHSKLVPIGPFLSRKVNKIQNCMLISKLSKSCKKIRQEKYLNKNAAKNAPFPLLFMLFKLVCLQLLLTHFVENFSADLNSVKLCDFVTFFDVKKSQSLYPFLHECHVHKNITISGCNLTSIYT
jgi:hypothetical protein